MIQIDTVHDFFELVRPLLQQGPVRIVVGASMIDLAPATDLTAVPEAALALIADTIQMGGQLRVVSDDFPPFIIAGR